MQHDINTNIEKDISIYKFITDDNSISGERPSYTLQSLAEEISNKILDLALEQLEHVSTISRKETKESSCDNHSINNTLINYRCRKFLVRKNFLKLIRKQFPKLPKFPKLSKLPN